MFNIGQLVWVWLKGEEPSSALVVKADEMMHGTYYTVLVEEKLHFLHNSRVWAEKENATKPFIFPGTKRIFPSLIANQMITVQPMSLPSALPFYLDYTFGSGSKNEE